MTSDAVQQPVMFRFQLSDWTLFSVRRPMVVKGFGLACADAKAPSMPEALPPQGSGVMLRSIQLPDARPSIAMLRNASGQRHLRYVLQCFPRYYIDMSKPWDAYTKKFSSKSRSTIARKVKKFTEHSGGELRWRRFTRADELDEFWELAAQVSALTYQERLLGAGLPGDAGYIEQAKRMAAADSLRAFLLFDGDRPVSYLFCPVRDGVVDYAYLGYDPAYLRLSVGTVLQWLALESLFAENRFRYFDFTEGESDHKRLFATGHIECANVALMRPTLANLALAYGHIGFNGAAEGLGRWLDRHDLKPRIKRWLRFGRATAA